MAIASLNNEGYETVMITGDNERTARAIAKEAGISEVIANVLPRRQSEKGCRTSEEGNGCLCW